MYINHRWERGEISDFMSAPTFRILKRESKEGPSSSSQSNPRGESGEIGVGSVGLSEQAYEKV
jgi:hypothetical protein